MSSSLASQLTKLQQRPSHDKKLAHSFLFTESDAKQFSREQIYELAVTGLQTLMSIDNRFHQFLSALFDRTTVRRERSMLVARDEEAASRSIDALLTFLSPHLLLTAAHQVLEYLVRVWEIHTYNVTAVLAAFLPFHDHPIFARMLLLLDLRDTGFESLQTNQLHGTVLLGSQLRVLCSESRRALNTVTQAAVNAFRLSVVNHGAFALFGGVGSSLATHPDGEAIFRTLLPVVSELLTEVPSNQHTKSEEFESNNNNKESAAHDAVRRESMSAALLVLAAWCLETQLGPKVLAALLRPWLSLLSRSDFPVSIKDALAVLCLVFRTQRSAVEQVTFQPTLIHIMRLPLHDWSVFLSHRSTNASSMITTLLGHVLQVLDATASLESVPATITQFLATCSQGLPLGATDVAMIVTTIASNAALHEVSLRRLHGTDAARTTTESASQESSVEAVLPALRRRYPVAFETALAALLKGSSGTTKMSEQQREAHDAKINVQKHFLEAFFAAESGAGGFAASDGLRLVDVSQHLAATSMKKGAVATSHINRLPLSVCLMHHLADVRTLALESLRDVNVFAALLASSVAGSDARQRSAQMLCELVLHCIRFEKNAKTAETACALITQWCFTAAAAIEAIRRGPATTDNEEDDDKQCRNNSEETSIIYAFFAHAASSLFALAVEFLNSSAAGDKGLVSVVLSVFHQMQKSVGSSSPIVEAPTAYFAILLHEVAAVGSAADSSAVGERVANILGIADVSNTSVKRMQRLPSLVSFGEQRVESLLQAAIRDVQSGEHHPEVASELTMLIKFCSLSPVQSHSPRSSVSLLRKMATFVHNTYIPLLVKRDHELAMQQASATGAAALASGRGAKTLTTSKNATNAFIQSISVASSSAVDGLLQSPPVGPEAQKQTVLLLADGLELLRALNAPVVAVARATIPQLVALALLHCLSRDAQSWISIASASLLAVPPVSGTSAVVDHACAETIMALIVTVSSALHKYGAELDGGEGSDANTNALAVSRRAFLQKWQDSILSKTTNSSPKSALQMAMSWFQAEKVLTPTAMSSIVEVHGVSLGEQQRVAAPIGASAATVLASCIAQWVPAALQALVMRSYFPLLSSLTIRGTAEQQQQRQSNAETLAKALVPRVIESLASAKGVPQCTVEVVQHLLALSAPAAADVANLIDTADVHLMLSVLDRFSVVVVSSSDEAAAAASSGAPQTSSLYRDVLTALSRWLRVDGAQGEDANPLIFSMSSKKKSTASKSDTQQPKLDALAATIAPKLFSLWSKHGVDGATFLSRTSGGFARCFLPFMVRNNTTSSSSAPAKPFEAIAVQHPALFLDFIADILERKFAVISTSEDVWNATAADEQASPLTARDALRLIQRWVVPAVMSQQQGENKEGTVRIVRALRLLRTIVQNVTSLHFDDEDSTSAQNDDEDGCYHAGAFFARVLALLPLASLWTGCCCSAAGGDVEVNAFVQYLDGLCSSIANTSSFDAANRQSLVKQALELISHVAAAPDHEEAKGVATESAAGTAVVAGLLKGLAPVLRVGSNNTSEAGSNVPLLHVALLALMLRLEAVENTESLRFRSAVEVCHDLLVSFDLNTQLGCLTGMMYVLLDPHHPLSGFSRDGGADALSLVDEATVAMVEKLLKPGRIINRQENILNLIAMTVKSDGFLGPFIEDQQRGARKIRQEDEKQKKKRSKPSAAGGEAEEDDEAAAAGAEEDISSTDSCMRLLLAALALFAKLSTLRQSVEASEGETTGDDDLRSEDASYALLLELLSGNVLACVLAGINEPTFVACQKRLLGHPSMTLQVKGLETLLDRLHQSVPTTEDTMSDKDAEQRRRDIRDPKKKLTTMDLLMLKARPLTTKRTMTLFPTIMALTRGAMKVIAGAGASNANTKKLIQARAQLVEFAQLAISAMEELVRIVGSGGSMVAATLLADAQRGAATTATHLSKLFGSKAKASEILQLLDLLLTYLNTFSFLDSNSDSLLVVSPSPSSASSHASFTILMSSMVTAVATITQTLGFAFVSGHSMRIIQTLTQVAWYSVVVEPYRAGCGVLLRQSALNSVIRCMSSTWLMVAPYLPRLLSVASSLANVNDAETAVLSTELLACMKALLEPRVLLEAACEATGGVAPLISTSTHSFVVLYGCVKDLLGRLAKADVGALSVLVSIDVDRTRNFWVASLHALATSTSLPAADTLNAVFDAYLAFIVKFKAEHCQRYFSTLITWAIEEMDLSSSGGSNKKQTAAASTNKRSLHRIIVFLALYNRMLEALTVLADFTFASGANVLTTMLTTYSSKALAKADEADEDEGGDYASSGRSSTRRKGTDSLVTVLLEASFDAVRRMSDAQCPLPDQDPATIVPAYFAEPNVFNALMPPLVQQMTNVHYLSDDTMDYEQRVRASTIPAIRAYMKCLSSTKLWSKTQAELLKALRSSHHTVRRAVLTAFRGIYADGGDEMAATIMSEMLPAVVEATEDTHEDVVEEARQLCYDLSNITGRDVLHSMS